MREEGLCFTFFYSKFFINIPAYTPFPYKKKMFGGFE